MCIMCACMQPMQSLGMAAELVPAVDTRNLPGHGRTDSREGSAAAAGVLFYGDSAANGVKASSFVEVDHLSVAPWLFYGSASCCSECSCPCSLRKVVSILSGERKLPYLSLAASVQELRRRQDLDRFVHAQPDNVLTVVNISSNETPCVRVFAAVLALAKSFQGYAAFGRLMYDASEEAREIAKELHVLQARAGGHALHTWHARTARSACAEHVRIGM